MNRTHTIISLWHPVLSRYFIFSCKCFLNVNASAVRIKMADSVTRHCRVLPRHPVLEAAVASTASVSSPTKPGKPSGRVVDVNADISSHSVGGRPTYLHRSACRAAGDSIQRSRADHNNFKEELVAASGDGKSTWRAAQRLLHSDSKVPSGRDQLTMERRLYVDPDPVDLIDEEPTEVRGQLLAVCVVMDEACR